MMLLPGNQWADGEAAAMSDTERVVGAQHGDSIVGTGPWTLQSGASKGRILVVEDEEVLRDALQPLLEEEGYEVSVAENGREALNRLHTESHTDIIVLDLRMPVMDGWEFRTIQKDDPKLGRIPVVAVSADGSAQAAAISAHAFLRKPVDAKELLATIGRILLENERQASVRLHETEWLASLDRLAAYVGHEINNPLTFVMLNLSHSLEALRPSIRSQEAPLGVSLPKVELKEIKARMVEVTDMLEECQIGGERIRETVRTLQRLSNRGEVGDSPVRPRSSSPTTKPSSRGQSAPCAVSGTDSASAEAPRRFAANPAPVTLILPRFGGHNSEEVDGIRGGGEEAA